MVSNDAVTVSPLSVVSLVSFVVLATTTTGVITVSTLGGDGACDGVRRVWVVVSAVAVVAVALVAVSTVVDAPKRAVSASTLAAPTVKNPKAPLIAIADDDAPSLWFALARVAGQQRPARAVAYAGRRCLRATEHRDERRSTANIKPTTLAVNTPRGNGALDIPEQVVAEDDRGRMPEVDGQRAAVDGADGVPCERGIRQSLDRRRAGHEHGQPGEADEEMGGMRVVDDVARHRLGDYPRGARGARGEPRSRPPSAIAFREHPVTRCKKPRHRKNA